MKHRIIAVLVLASAAVVQIQAAEAGPLLDALRNKAGQAVFLGKVAKANLGTAAHPSKWRSPLNFSVAFGLTGATNILGQALCPAVSLWRGRAWLECKL
jgi:hypothetical protein